jgi:hypothetical protein
MTDSNDDIDRDKAGQGDEPEQPVESAPESRRGSVRYQDADTTTPREPTLAEKRARLKAVHEEEERLRTEVAQVERKSLRRRRVMIGAGVTVGIVATVAVWYAAASPDEVTANCIDDRDTLSSSEDICSESYVTSHGGYHSGGFFFLPIGGGNYQSYHYNYGGTVGPDRRVSGGSTVAPSSSTRVKSTSGKTVQRGGFGVSGGGKSGGS